MINQGLEFASCCGQGQNEDSWVKVGEGAYATVERGSFCGQLIVRKRMKQPMKSDSHDSAFHSEIAVLSSLPENSAVVGYLGYEVKHNIGIIFLENCDLSLSAYLAKHERNLSLPAASVIINQLCHGLAFLYEQQICHRDIKPDNILISQSGGMCVKYADFGCAVNLRDKKNPDDLLACIEDSMNLMTPVIKPIELWDQGHLHNTLKMSSFSPTSLLTLFKIVYNQYHTADSYQLDRQAVVQLVNELWLLGIDDGPINSELNPLRHQVEVMCQTIMVLLQLDMFSLGMTVLAVLSHWSGYERANQIVFAHLNFALGTQNQRVNTPNQIKANMATLLFKLNVQEKSYEMPSVSSPTTVRNVP